MRINQELGFDMLTHFKDLLTSHKAKERNFPSIKSELENEFHHYKQETDEMITLLKEDVELRQTFLDKQENCEDCIEFTYIKELCVPLDMDLEEPVFSEFIQNVIDENDKLFDICKGL